MNDVVLVLLLPLIAAFLAPVGKLISKRFGRFLNPLLYALGIILSIIFLSRSGVDPSVTLGGWRAPFGINLYAGTFALSVVLLINVIAFFISVYDLNRDRKAYYYLMFNLFVFSAMGMTLTGDLFNLFVMMEIGAISLIALSSANSEKAGSKASFRYVVMSGALSVLMLAAIGLIYSAQGNINIAALSTAPPLAKGLALVSALGLIVALFMEMELFPFNAWVPPVYNASASSFSAGIAGIGGLAGIAAFARISTQLFGGFGAFEYGRPAIQLVIVVFALTSIVAGELSALSEKNLKKVMGYSSIGQMGLAVIAFMVAGTFGLRAGIYLILSHSIAKVLLLFISGYFIRKSGRMKWDEMKGIGRSYPLLAVLFIIGALSLMGIPLFVGFWGKYNLIRALLDGALIWKISAAVILFATVIEGVYFMRISHSFFEKNEKNRDYSYSGVLLVSLPGMLLALALLWGGILPKTFDSVTDRAVNDLQNTAVYAREVLGVEWNEDSLIPMAVLETNEEELIEEIQLTTNLIIETNEAVPAVDMDELMNTGGRQ